MRVKTKSIFDPNKVNAIDGIDDWTDDHYKKEYEDQYWDNKLRNFNALSRKDQFGSKKKHLQKPKLLVVMSMKIFSRYEVDDETFFMPCKTHEEYDEKNENRSEERSEHIDVPDYIQSNAQRGLDNLDRAGDGLVERTITEARALARGSITEDKLRRLSAWIKRHRGDLQSEQVKDGEISAGVVAHWLWGSGSAEISVESMLEGADRTLIGQIVKLAN